MFLEIFEKQYNKKKKTEQKKQFSRIVFFIIKIVYFRCFFISFYKTCDCSFCLSYTGYTLKTNYLFVLINANGLRFIISQLN